MPRPQRFPWQLPSRHMPLLLCHGGLECVFTNGSSHWIFRGVNPVTIVLVKDVQVSEIGVLHPRFFQSQWPQHALVSVLAFQIQPEIAGYERMKLMEYTGVYTGDEANSTGPTSGNEKRELQHWQESHIGDDCQEKSHAFTAPVSLACI